jgi:hypothetical protein
MGNMSCLKGVWLAAACGFITACGGGESGGGSVSLPVDAGNNLPQISGAPIRTASVGQLYQFTPSASDADGDTLTFRIDNRPDWATFSPSTGRLEGTPPNTAQPNYERILISVTDGQGFSELPAFDINVQGLAPPANTAPTISGTPAASIVAGNAYEFIPQVVDPDGQALVFSVVGQPAWAEFDSLTGRFWGTPGAGDVGTHSGIVISVSDGIATASLTTFSIEVTGGTNPGPSNRPPVISGTPATSGTVGQAYSFTSTASDPDGQALTFSIANRPSWASFNTSTGRLSGTPTAADVGSYTNVSITVSDGAAQASLAPFTIVVAAAAVANRPPVISGTPPASGTVGQAYSFTPTASDPDGQALTFSITNRPSWATFNTSTGRLSGTPTAANAGSYSAIVISVSDGTASVSLPSFTLTVQQVQTGSATISWTPPTTNADGSPLTNLRGYKIYYGTNSSNLTQVLDLPNPGTSRGVVENLAPGTWYFAVTSYNSSNVESNRSNVTSKTI